MIYFWPFFCRGHFSSLSFRKCCLLQIGASLWYWQFSPYFTTLCFCCFFFSSSSKDTRELQLISNCGAIRILLLPPTRDFYSFILHCLPFSLSTASKWPTERNEHLEPSRPFTFLINRNIFQFLYHHSQPLRIPLSTVTRCRHALRASQNKK